MRHLSLTLTLLSLLLAACAPVAATPTSPPAPTQGFLATPPHNTPSAASPLLEWQDEECHALDSDGQNLSYGPCDGELTTVPAGELDLLRLNQWRALYALIEAGDPPTPAGTLKFQGEGSVEATEAERRAMAEWAALRYQELESGRTSAAWSLALDWHREGGIAGFCDEVTVYLTGDYFVTNCKAPTPTPAATVEPTLPRHLDPGQLEQLYGWYDTLETFDYNYTDPAVSDAMTTRFTFSGRGKEQATEQDIQDINAFASNLTYSVSVGSAAHPPAALAAQQALADSLGVPVSDVSIVSATPEEWPDSCLGIAPPDVMCAQVITPGYLVMLEANGVQYTYRTDQTGDQIAAEP